MILICIGIIFSFTSLVAQMEKEPTCNVEDLGLILGLGKSLGGEHGNPLQYSCLDNPHGRRSLEGYSPWGHRVRHDWKSKHNIFLPYLQDKLKKEVFFFSASMFGGGICLIQWRITQNISRCSRCLADTNNYKYP